MLPYQNELLVLQFPLPMVPEHSISLLQESSSFKTLAGNLDAIKISRPLWVLLENVDLGDSSDDDSNGAMLTAAMLDVGYCTRTLFTSF